MFLGREGALPWSCGSAGTSPGRGQVEFLGELEPPRCLSSRQTKEIGIIPAGTGAPSPKLCRALGPFGDFVWKLGAAESVDLFPGKGRMRRRRRGEHWKLSLCSFFRAGLSSASLEGFSRGAAAAPPPGAVSPLVPSCHLLPAATPRKKGQFPGGFGDKSLRQTL